MKKSILNLGNPLNTKQQQKINGGSLNYPSCSSCKYNRKGSKCIDRYGHLAACTSSIGGGYISF